MPTDTLKARVSEFWEQESCGARYGRIQLGPRDFYAAIDASRYELDWMIPGFACFERYRDKHVLEVGLGTGADFVRWVWAGAIAHGRDLTAASVSHVNTRLALECSEADVRQGDAEHLDLPDNSVDLYYSWGVLHHTPDTAGAVAEAYRVLKPGGELKIMIYHSRSVAAVLVWLARGIWKGKGIRRSVNDHLESPGTKIYSRAEAARLVSAFESVEIRTWLAAGDLLLHEPSSRYRSRLWNLCYRLYPRWLVRLMGDRAGLALTIHARKPLSAAAS